MNRFTMCSAIVSRIFGSNTIQLYFSKNIFFYSLPYSVKINKSQHVNMGQRYMHVHTIVNSSHLESPGSRQSKEKLIKKMNFSSKEDAKPFYDLSIDKLMIILRTTLIDVQKEFCNNRLYYIANLIKCKPSVLSKPLSRRIFIYTLSQEWLQSSLHTLLEMGVCGDRIMRDLWVLKYNHETIKKRLQIVKDSGFTMVYPWMVRCPEEVLYRSLKISQDIKDILGDDITTKEYLASRLSTTTDVIEEMCIKLPYLRRIRVTRAKSFLDYLFSQGISKEEIIEKPRILSSSQKTIESRLNKLRSLGVQLNMLNINILCKQDKTFQKYCDNLEKTKHYSR